MTSVALVALQECFVIILDPFEIMQNTLVKLNLSARTG